MVPQDKQLVLSLEQSIPPTVVKPLSFSTIGGYIDYAVFSASVSDKGRFLRQFYFSSSFSADFFTRSHLDKLQDSEFDHTLFVLKAKTSDIYLEDHVPQTVSEMCACAKRSGSVGFL